MNLRDALHAVEKTDGTAWKRYQLLKDAVEQHLAQLEEVTEHGFLMLPTLTEQWPEGGRVLFKGLGWGDTEQVVATRTRLEYVSDWEYSVDPATLPGDVRYGPRGTLY